MHRSINNTKLAGAALALVLLFVTYCAPASLTPSEQKGGAIVLALSQEPETLNPYLAAQRNAAEVHIFVIEGLLGVNEKAEFFPQLAKVVPTKENGGVSADSLTVTYHLRQGVTWSGSQPFTCDDVKFTWEAVVHPKRGAVATTDYRDIDSVTCPDPETAVIKFKQFYARYFIPFWTVLPRHATSDPAAMTSLDPII